MTKAILLARREYFGYLFYNTHSGDLFVSKTDNDIDFSQDFVIKDSSGAVYSSKDVRLLASFPGRSGILSAPTYVEIYPTLFCNERCKFCYVGDKLNSYLPGMSRSDAEKLANDLVENGVFEVSILGGEPFLYKDLPWLLDLFGKKGFELSLSTNGTVYNESVFEKIKQYGIDLNLSFHSHLPEIHSRIVNNAAAYGKMLSNLRLMIQEGISPHVSFLITKENQDTILDTIKFLHKEDIKRISIFHTMKAGFVTNSSRESVDFNTYKTLFLKASKLGAELGVKVTSRTNFPFLIYENMEFNTELGLSNILYGTVDTRRILYVLYDGSTYSTMYKLKDKQEYIGNVLTEGLNSIWTKSNNLEALRNSPPLNHCSNCRHFEYCRGGSVINYISRTRDEPPECPLHSQLLAE